MTDQASVVSSLFPVAKSGLFTSRSHASVWDRKLKDTLDAVKRIVDPAKAAEKEAADSKRAANNAVAKAEARARRAEEKEAAKEAANAAKEADKSARHVRKMIGDTLKGKLKGKKKHVNGRRTYIVPGSTAIFYCVSPSDFDHIFSMYGVTVKPTIQARVLIVDMKPVIQVAE